MKNKRCFYHLLCVALALAIPAYCVAMPSFNFDSLALGTATPFSDTSNGLTATFSSPYDPGAFEVGSTFFLTLTGNVLLDPGPGNVAFALLNVDFSANAAAVSLAFATDGPGTFTLDAYEFGTHVGAASAVGTIPNGFTFPEGTISFSGATFNEIVLYSPSTPYFAIDNLTVTTVPEPSGLLLITTGFLGVASRLRKR